MSPSANFTTSGQFLTDWIEELKAKEQSDSDGSTGVFDVWERQPVDIETFLYDEKHLNLSITLSPPQLEFVETLSNIFTENPITEGVLMAGQGSGKDTCSIFVGLRIIYLLNCLKSPQKYFNMEVNSFIDAINVAPNADLARNIYFQTLINILRSAPLFDPDVPGSIKYTATQQVVNFPKNVRLISGNSENESWQGYTPILILLDEIDAFKSEQEMRRSSGLRSEGAEGIYKTAKSLIQSRFPGIGRVVSLSWPRFRGSFIQRRFEAGKMEERTYVACKPDGEAFATWDFNPSKKKEDFKDFYENDPILAKARFECDPPYARDAYIRDPIPVLRCFAAEIDEKGDVLHSRMKPIRDESLLQQGIYYFIHVDLGLRHSNAALAIAHQEGENVILDLMKTWISDPDRDVDFRSIENFILGLREKGFKIASVTYDKYQSVNSLQTLQAAGIPAKYKSVTRTKEAYDTLKDLIYQEKLDGYFDKEAIEEILGLDLVHGERVEARPGMNKDRADAVAGAIHGALKESGVLTRMSSIGNLNSLFSSPTATVNADPATKNPVLEEMNNPAKGFRRDEVASRIVSSSKDFCDTCQRVGGIEFEDDAGSRCFEPTQAIRMQCIICGTKWERINQSAGWNIIREPDQFLMAQITGFSN